MGLNQNVVDFATSDGNGDGTYTVTRRADGTLVKGRVVPGSTSSITITASVQPYDGKGLVVAPEGFHTTDVRKIFTDTALVAAAGHEDVVTIGGEAFKIFRVNGPWELDGDVHYECLAARQVVP